MGRLGAAHFVGIACGVVLGRLTDMGSGNGTHGNNEPVRGEGFKAVQNF